MKKTFLILAIAILPACGLTYDLDGVGFNPVDPERDMGGSPDADASSSDDMMVGKGMPDGDVSDVQNPNEIITHFSTDQEDATYTIGEEIELFVETNRAGSLTLEITKSNGLNLRLIPKDANDSPVPIAANTRITLPTVDSRQTFSAGSPRGVDTVQVNYLNENGTLLESARVSVTVE